MERSRPFLWGVNHLKLPTSDIRRTQNFYCNVMGMEYLAQYDFYNQQQELIICLVRLKHTEEDATLIEIRLDEAQALAQQGMDPITYAVRSRESLEGWKTWFEQNGVQCGSVYGYQTLKGWALSATDPDGRIVRIYSDEKHERNIDVEAVHDF